ncbi:MAG TPA: hypothetical protein EYG80_05245 [Flavobacteriaceae bacterium]|nr:hypothetical protein [Flavobacteriaceae bacterium]
MILYSKFRFKNYIAITVFPFILINKNYKGNKALINHEKIHLKQQLELLIIPFYLWYIIEFLIKLIKYKSWHMAYLNISFEKEAYQNDYNLEYLKYRKWFAFIKYF